MDENILDEIDEVLENLPDAEEDRQLDQVLQSVGLDIDIVRRALQHYLNNKRKLRPHSHSKAKRIKYTRSDTIDKAVALVAFIEKHKDAFVWQDISDAPKDGTSLILRYYKGKKPSYGRSIAYDDFYAIEGFWKWDKDSSYNHETKKWTFTHRTDSGEWQDYAGRLLQKIPSKSKNIVTRYKHILTEAEEAEFEELLK